LINNAIVFFQIIDITLRISLLFIRFKVQFLLNRYDFPELTFFLAKNFNFDEVNRDYILVFVRLN
jgi:hypothetical protein